MTHDTALSLLQETANDRQIRATLVAPKTPNSARYALDLTQRHYNLKIRVRTLSRYREVLATWSVLTEQEAGEP